MKQKPIATRLHTPFSRALRHLHVITLSFDWLTGYSAAFWLAGVTTYSFTTRMSVPFVNKSRGPRFWPRYFNVVRAIVLKCLWCIFNWQSYFYNDDTFNFNYAQAKAAVGNYKEAEEVGYHFSMLTLIYKIIHFLLQLKYIIPRESVAKV